MLTDRQLADIEADVSTVLGSERGVTPNERLLARHCRYLLDEVARLKLDAHMTKRRESGLADQ